MILFFKHYVYTHGVRASFQMEELIFSDVSKFPGMIYVLPQLRKC